MSETKHETILEKRNFPFAKPRRWQNRKTKKQFKVLPWFQPIDDSSRFDFKGLMLDIVPELKNDIIAMSEVYSGMVVLCGWQIHNDAGLWFCMEHGIEDQFEDLGYWVETEGEEHICFPLTKKSVAKAKRLKKKKKEKKKIWG